MRAMSRIIVSVIKHKHKMFIFVMKIDFGFQWSFMILKKIGNIKTQWGLNTSILLNQFLFWAWISEENILHILLKSQNIFLSQDKILSHIANNHYKTLSLWRRNNAIVTKFVCGFYIQMFLLISMFLCKTK